MTGTDVARMQQAIGLSTLCPPSGTAYSVGAVIVGPDGAQLATGYSRETDPHVHAEEVALSKLGNDPRLQQATIYSTLEPCSTRRNQTRPCAELIIAAGLPRVIIAWREPTLFADCIGAELLTLAGVTLIEVPELAAAARAVNAHLLEL